MIHCPICGSKDLYTHEKTFCIVSDEYGNKSDLEEVDSFCCKHCKRWFIIQKGENVPTVDIHKIDKDFTMVPLKEDGEKQPTLENEPIIPLKTIKKLSVKVRKPSKLRIIKGE